MARCGRAGKPPRPTVDLTLAPAAARAGSARLLWAFALLAVPTSMAASGSARLAAQRIVPPPPHYHVDYGLGGPGLLRYNRAEGLFLGVASERTVDRLGLHGDIGIALTDPLPQLTIGTVWKGPGHRVRAELFHRMHAFNPEVRPLAIANSASFILTGLDEGEYYRSTGALVEVSAPTLEPFWTLSLYFERQVAPKSNVEFNLPGWPFPERRGRALSPVSSLRQTGVAGRVSGAWTTDPASPSADVWARVRAETGGARFADMTVRGSVEVPVMSFGWVVLRGGAHASRGEVPWQRLALVGGPSRVRGFDGAAAMGPTATWGRTELRLRSRATILAFFDAGWAGVRGDRTASAAPTGEMWVTSRTLASTGVGLSVLDHLLHAHIARRLRGGRGWQIHLYLDVLR